MPWPRMSICAPVALTAGKRSITVTLWSLRASQKAKEGPAPPPPHMRKFKRATEIPGAFNNF
ncbi:uncharacterized protein PRCAT00006304001 [Priceomyces carsonii]|uniref:uncharacterized protein n=1 Tax=Priceomyces carsonii TaxID=28549 RepID=UPI002ED99985|nr:unnamed protein product [Priceomyces carsonii]